MYQFPIDYAKSCGFVFVLTVILIVPNCKQVKHVQRFTTVQWSILDLEVAPPSTLSWPWWGKNTFRRNKQSGWWLQPLWKIWNSAGMIIPNIIYGKIKNCSNVPNHQPDNAHVWIDCCRISPRYWAILSCKYPSLYQSISNPWCPVKSKITVLLFHYVPKIANKIEAVIPTCENDRFVSVYGTYFFRLVLKSPFEFVWQYGIQFFPPVEGINGCKLQVGSILRHNHISYHAYIYININQKI